MALNRPNHEWSLVATGPEALVLSSMGLIVTVPYAIGCIRYAGSKGYGTGIGLLLFIANLPGFLIMLLLPDRTKHNEISESVLEVQHR
jgi:hypothetical protein